ncbi:hypothetical protein [uncultured Flavobacterium sp.]|uniref:hypothetical protein n=1 Tax=uncultured Flavobacterium sp. TaxID=165435 RepID=UPI0025CD7D86|nr:hypothetical protein [uncultured Flavobacterium sp.]
MKKSILSLIALFSVAAVSAQSYAKQPDPTIYEVVKYEKPAVEQTEIKEQPLENKTGVSEARPNTERKDETVTAEVKNPAIAASEQKAQPKKEQ